MTNKELYESCEPKSIIRRCLKEFGKIQSEVLEENLSVKNQMIITGIAYTIADMKRTFDGEFESEFSVELKILDYNHEEFYKKNQEHING
jgi:hypothetical protein